MFGCLFIYMNWDWLIYMWKNHGVDEYHNVVGDKEPPFCFDCDCSECEDCDAYKAWKIDPNQGWKIWAEMEKRRSIKF